MTFFKLSSEFDLNMIAAISSAIIFSTVLVLQTAVAQTPPNNTTATTNLSQQISQQITSDTFLVGIAYESPNTVVLQGSDGKSSVGGSPGQLAFNDLLWKAVDLVKDKGYVIDNIDLLITGENSNIYRIYMSQPEEYSLAQKPSTSTNTR